MCCGSLFALGCTVCSRVLLVFVLCGLYIYNFFVYMHDASILYPVPVEVDKFQMDSIICIHVGIITHLKCLRPSFCGKLS